MIWARTRPPLHRLCATPANAGSLACGVRWEEEIQHWKYTQHISTTCNKKHLKKSEQLFYIYQCVNLGDIVCEYDSIFDVGVKFDIFGFGRVWLGIFLVNTCVSNTTSLKYVSDQEPNAKWPHKPWEHICLCQNLDLTLYCTIKTSISKLRVPLRFLCLINSCYRRCASCMYNISKISNISNITRRLQQLETTWETSIV